MNIVVVYYCCFVVFFADLKTIYNLDNNMFSYNAYIFHITFLFQKGSAKAPWLIV